MSTKVLRNATFMLSLSQKAAASRAVENHLENAAALKKFEEERAVELDTLFSSIAESAQKGAIRMFFHTNTLLEDKEIQRYLSMKGFSVSSNCIEWFSPQPVKDAELR